jgi:hydroxyacyl-ACP dehydratase HTD2-like protein with hotdog domain
MASSPETDGPRYETLEPGRTLPPLEVTPTIAQLFLYSAVTWNAHRIHYDSAYAATEGYPAPVIHGPFQGALLSRLVIEWCGNRGSLSRLSYSHRGIAFLGDTLICKAKIAKKHEADGVPLVDLDLTVETQQGQVTTLGHATVAFPR